MKNKILKIIIIFAVVCGMMDGMLCAADDRNDLLGEANSFARGLMKDPMNKDALTGLRALAHRNNLPRQKRKNLLLWLRLQDKVEELRERVKVQENRRNRLGQDLVSKGEDPELIAEMMSGIKTDILQAATSFSESNRADEKKPLSVDEMDLLIVSLRFEKQELNRRMVYLGKQYEALVNLRQNKAASHMNARSVEGVPPAQTVQIQSELSSIPEGSNRALGDSLQKNVSNLENEFLDLRSRFDEREKKLATLADQVVEFSLKLTEKDMKLRETQDNISRLKVQLEELNSRFELGQQIIQEKDSRIEALESNFHEVQSKVKEYAEALDKVILTKDREIGEARGILSIYKEKFYDAVKTNKENAAILADSQQKLFALQTEIQEKNDLLEKAKDQLLLFENEIRSLEERFTRFEDVAEDASPITRKTEQHLQGVTGSIDKTRLFLDQLLSFKSDE